MKFLRGPSCLAIGSQAYHEQYWMILEPSNWTFTTW